MRSVHQNHTSAKSKGLKGVESMKIFSLAQISSILKSHQNRIEQQVLESLSMHQYNTNIHELVKKKLRDDRYEL